MSALHEHPIAQPAHVRTLKLPLIASNAQPSDVGLQASLYGELQSLGMRWTDPHGPGLSRTGGAGPSDHKAVRLADQVLMVPIFNAAAAASPFEAVVDASGKARLYREGASLRGYRSHASLDSTLTRRVTACRSGRSRRCMAKTYPATTVLQNCVRYADPKTSCQFCAIGRSLAARSTIARKSPAQLAEVAKIAVELDGVGRYGYDHRRPTGRRPGRGHLVATLRRRSKRPWHYRFRRSVSRRQDPASVRAFESGRGR